MTKIGVIKEGKVPIDKRVPLIPSQAKYITDHFSELNLVVQSSDIRCYEDDSYRSLGIEVVDSVQDCDILLGVKEVQINDLIPEKQYFFFSHTIKKQDYNRELLKSILDQKIQLTDWETLRNSDNLRIIAFGRWAGIVGAYNALWTFGRRYNLFETRRAFECFDYADLKSEFSKIKLPKIKIVITGGGRVAKGAMEVMHGVGIKKVTPSAFLSQNYNEPVFTQLNSRDYNKRKDGGEFSRNDFYKHPENYEGDFVKYTHVADILIASAFWDPAAPKLFTSEDVTHGDFMTNVIADITCDIDGSIPATKRPSTIEDPIYDYNPSEDQVEAALSDEANITMMAVDNLPCELPRDASESFGNQFIENVLPSILDKDTSGIIHRASITTSSGKLNEGYEYLQDYIEGKE